MRWIHAATCCLCLAMLTAGSCATAKAADGSPVFLQESFDDPAATLARQLQGAKRLAAGEGVKGGSCAKFVIPAGKVNVDDLVSVTLDAAALRGKAVLLEAMMRAENLTEPQKKYLGPKLMLAIKSPQGNYHPDQKRKYGTYGWERFSVFTRIPPDATEVTLTIGLQACTGTLWVDDMKIVLPPLQMPQPDLALIASPRQARPLLRGVMSGAHCEEEDIRYLAENWKANFIRYQLVQTRQENATVNTPEKYDAWLERKLAEMDRMLPHCQKYGIKVLIDLHTAPGNTTQDKLLSNLLIWDNQAQNHLVEVWKKIGARYKDHPVIWGYDILNEPREEGYEWREGGPLDWNHLAAKIATALRAVDPVKPIVIEPAEWGSPKGLLNFVPVNVPNVVYSIHFYAPGSFTHQGIYHYPAGVVYPGTGEGETWNAARLRKDLQPAIDFQKKYGVNLLVGEFSVARWAPAGSAERWLEDVITVFEENGWDWCYHAFREADCWDAEMGPTPSDKQRLPSTPRMELLKTYFNRNAAR